VSLIFASFAGDTKRDVNGHEYRYCSWPYFRVVNKNVWLAQRYVTKSIIFCLWL